MRHLKAALFTAIFTSVAAFANSAARAQVILPFDQWQVTQSNAFTFYVVVGGGPSFLVGVGGPSQTGTLSQSFSFAAGQYTLAYLSSGTTAVPGGASYVQLVASVGGTSLTTYAPDQSIIGLLTTTSLSPRTLALNVPTSGPQSVLFAFSATAACPVLGLDGCGIQFDWETVTLTLVSVAPISGQLPSSLPTNIASVASAIDGIGPNPAAYPGAVLTLLTATQQQMLALLPQFTGEVATGAQQGAFALMSGFLNGMVDPFQPGRRGFERGSSAPPTGNGPSYLGATERRPLSQSSNLNTWGAFYRGYSRNDGASAVGSNERTVRDTGFITGADVALTRNSVAGLAISGGRTD